jgi:tetratricopeptide (TPR) repeat protein
MQHRFERQWQRARGHETSGNLAAAKATYESILQGEPDRLYVRLRLSALEQATGHYRASRAHVLQAARIVSEKQAWKDLATVARRLLTFDEGGALHDLVLGADWSDPEILKSSAMLSQYLCLTDRFADALRLIDVASPRARTSHVLSYSRANALRYCGRMDEATAEYERCLQLAPDYAFAHWSLAYHEKSGIPGSRLDRIGKARASFAKDAPEQAYLYYAQFKELDDAGEIDLAWESLEAGARIKRKEFRYDPALEREGFLALRQLATADFVRGNPREIPPGTIPIFVVGLPRTGTTVLERILGNHGQVTAAGELNDFNTALSLESDSFPTSSISPASVESMRNIDYSRIGDIYMQRIHGKANGRPWLIDKNPVNFINAGYICKALPQAKIVCLKRDPMDACLSNLKELFSNDAYGYSYDLDELADHYIHFDRLCEHWQRVLPGQFQVVDYESLATDPITTAEQVMGFCGMPFEPDCIDITRNKAPVSTASSSQVRQPVNARAIGAWRRYANHLEPLHEKLRRVLPVRA